MIELLIWAAVLLGIIVAGHVSLRASRHASAPSQTDAALAAGLIWLVGGAAFAVALAARAVVAWVV